MFEQEIERKIGDFRELGFPEFIPRESRLQMVDNMVSTVIGTRRAGKSYRTIQAILLLITTNTKNSSLYLHYFVVKQKKRGQRKLRLSFPFSGFAQMVMQKILKRRSGKVHPLFFRADLRDVHK